MAQWDVYPNPSSRSRDRLPYVVDIQSNLLDPLPTRMVMPLSRSSVARGDLPPRLAPEFTIRGETLLLKAHEASHLLSRDLRRPVTSLRDQAHRLVDAFDAVISGI